MSSQFGTDLLTVMNLFDILHLLGKCVTFKCLYFFIQIIDVFQLLSILENQYHPLPNTLRGQWSAFSKKLTQLRCHK